MNSKHGISLYGLKHLLSSYLPTGEVEVTFLYKLYNSMLKQPFLIALTCINEQKSSQKYNSAHAIF